LGCRMTESIETSTAPRGRLSIRTVAMPADTNPHGAIFGGWVLAQMDLAGGTHAFHRAKGLVVTVAVDSMTFHEPVFVGDEFSCYTEIVRIGNSSISVRCEAWVRRDNRDEQIKVTSAMFHFVAVNPDRSKRRVPAE